MICYKNDRDDGNDRDDENDRGRLIALLPYLKPDPNAAPPAFTPGIIAAIVERQRASCQTIRVKTPCAWCEGHYLRSDMSTAEYAEMRRSVEEFRREKKNARRRKGIYRRRRGGETCRLA